MTDHPTPHKSSQEPLSPNERQFDWRRFWPVGQWGSVVVLLYLLLTAISLLSIGAQSFLGNQARSLFEVATHPILGLPTLGLPILGLLVGTVATALLQSSSAVTSIIVGLVAGGLPMAIAIPMVMGANIGTTVTNLIVSLGHMRHSEEFRRAFAAAIVHDLFNLSNVAIFLPLELAFGLLSQIGLLGARMFVGRGGVSMGQVNIIKAATEPLVAGLQAALAPLPSPINHISLMLIGITIVIGTLFRLSRLLHTLMVGRAKEWLLTMLGRGSLAGIASGAAVTALVQSSSTTTSLMVPLAGAGIVSLHEIYPFILGANIGTCMTALLAAMAVPAAGAVPALQIAIVHFAFNGLGVMVIYGIPILRPLPIWIADAIATWVVSRRVLAIACLMGVFVVIPACFLSLTLVPR